MKLFILVILAIPGLVLLATPALPVGLGMLWLGWWIYERSSLPNGDEFITVLMVLGGIGAAIPVVQFAWQRITALL